jgi:hypothetical protein
VVLEEQVVEKERCIQHLADSLLVRVVKSHMQTGTKRLKGSESGSAEAVSAVLFQGVAAIQAGRSASGEQGC